MAFDNCANTTTGLHQLQSAYPRHILRLTQYDVYRVLGGDITLVTNSFQHY